MVMDVSIVVPTHRGEAHLARLCEATGSAMAGAGWAWELILVDDASPDGTWAEVQRLVSEGSATMGLRLARNVGQVGATLAGFAAARGSVIVMMDDDLDVDPAVLPALIAAVPPGLGFASGRRRGRRHRFRGWASGAYNRRLRSWGLPFDDAGCGCNAMTSEVAQRLVQLGWGARMHRFKPAVHAMGAAVANVDVGPSSAGSSRPSTYTAVSLAASWLDVEMRFGRRSPGAVRAAFIGAPGLGALACSCLAQRARRGSIAAVGAAIASAVLVVAAIAAIEIDRRRMADDRASRELAPFDVAERCGQALTTDARRAER